MKNRTKFLIMLVGFFAFAATGFAQKAGEVKVWLRDGTVMKGKAVIGNVNFETKYGKLVIPVKNFSTVEFGISANKSTQSKVNGLLDKLKSTDETEKTKAFEQLTEGELEFIPAIDNYMYSDNYDYEAFEDDYSPEAVVETLMSKYNIETYQEDDIITVDYTSTFAGKMDIDKIDVQTEYGKLSVPRKKISKIENLYVDEDQNGVKIFKLIASKHISSNKEGGWLNTKIQVKSGQPFSINASGTITLASLSNNKYTPNGKVGEDYSGKSSSLQYGNVTYKIGQNGSKEKVGSKFKGTAKTSGTLYISIYETVYNSSNKGFYVVKIK